MEGPETRVEGDAAAHSSLDEMRNCAGSPAVFDLQASQLRVCEEELSDDGQPTIRCLLEEPVLFHEFIFSPPASNMQLTDHKRVTGQYTFVRNFCGFF